MRTLDDLANDPIGKPAPELGPAQTGPFDDAPVAIGDRHLQLRGSGHAPFGAQVARGHHGGEAVLPASAALARVAASWRSSAVRSWGWARMAADSDFIMSNTA